MLSCLLSKWALSQNDCWKVKAGGVRSAATVSLLWNLLQSLPICRTLLTGAGEWPVLAVITCNVIGWKIPDWSNVDHLRNSMGSWLSRWPCTGMIDGPRVHVMSCVCYDWSSVGAGMTVPTATVWFLTDRCILPDIHTAAPCIGSQTVCRETCRDH